MRFRGKYCMTFYYGFSRLREIFNLENNEIDLKEAAILDYYTSAVYWGIQQKFTAQQVSGFFSVIHTLLDNVKGKLCQCTYRSIDKEKK